MKVWEAFTVDEIKDLAVSVIALILIFSWVGPPNFGFDIAKFPSIVVIIVVAFLAHEMAHKFMARKFGLVSYYKMWVQGIVIGLVLMIFGLKFVAPGAVQVHPYRFGRWQHRQTNISVAEMGITSAVGPLTNIILAIIGSLFTGVFFETLVFINAWLALINLLPIKPLDGSKIVIWKPWTWGFMFFTSIILLVLAIF